MLAEASRAAAFSIGFSTKAYFSHATVLEWLRVALALPQSPSVLAFLVPSHPSIAEAARIASGSLLIGAQNVSVHMPGPHTGEVTAELLREVGADFVELGHAEHRANGDSDQIIARKVDQAISQGLDVLLCVGESSPVSPGEAAKYCVEQIRASAVPRDRLVVAYEPVWAIGSSEPAGAAHITQTVAAIKTELGVGNLPVIYGGTAGPGMLADIAPTCDGLFLGRRAHDPHAFGQVVAEALALTD